MHRFPRTFELCLFSFLLLSTARSAAQDWPQWRGPNRDNKVVGFTEPKTWPKELVKKWKISVGVGEASPILVGDKLYTFGRQGSDEVAMCLDAASGKEVWKEKYAAAFSAKGDSAYPGPRSTPAVADGKVITLGVNGLLICRDVAKGSELWRQDKGFPQFHTSTSPMVADGLCFVLAGTLAAYDLADGKPKWTSKDVKAGYGSPVFMTVDGVKQIVTPCADALVGVDVKSGNVLWDVKIGSAWQNSYSTPIIDGNRVYFSITPAGKFGKGGAGAATGLIALEVAKTGETFAAKQIWKADPAAGYHTPVLVDGRLYGATSAAKVFSFFCLDAKSGKPLWADKTNRGQCGSILNAGSVLLSVNADKYLVAFRPSAKGYEEVAKYQVSNAETWCVPIIAGNRIYVKDKDGALTLWTLD